MHSSTLSYSERGRLADRREFRNGRLNHAGKSCCNSAPVGSYPVYGAAENVTENTEKWFKALNQESQRPRSTLESVRLSAQNEVKRFKKEKDKLLKHPSKITDQFACSNLNVSMM